MKIKFFVLSLAVFLFLLSLLAIFRAPTNLTWKISILVQEAGYFFALLSLVLLMLSIYRHWIFPTGLYSLALIFFLYPLFSSIWGTEIRSGFGEYQTKISLARLLRFPDLTMPRSENYLYSSEKNLSMDFYASSHSAAPCIIVVHGGGWDSGDSHQLALLNGRLQKEGYAVASVNYRLAPDNQYPAPLKDLSDALEYLRKHAVELRIDPNRLFLLGRSAGGQIALMGAYTWPEKIKGVISFYAPADMVWGYSIPGNPWIMDSRKVLCNYIGGPCEVMPERYKMASPVEQVRPGLPPTLIIHGKKDVLVAYEHSIRLYNKLRKSDIPVVFLSLPWATHGFDFLPDGPGTQLSDQVIMKFIKNCLWKK